MTVPAVLNQRLHVPKVLVSAKQLLAYTYKVPGEDGVPVVLEMFQESDYYYSFCRGDLAKIFNFWPELEIDDQRAAPKMKNKLTFTGELYPNQMDAVNTWLKAGYGCLQAPARFGKTVSLCYMTCKLKLKTLILTHQVDLLEQFLVTFQKWSNMNEFDNSVGFVNEWEDIYKYDVCLLTYQRFVTGKDGAQKLKEFKDVFGLVVVDECHEYKTKVMIDYDKCLNIGDIVNSESITHVLAYDLDKKEIVKRKILRKMQKESDIPRVGITIRNDKGDLVFLKPTGNHRYYVVGKGYTPAQDLQPGDKLIQYDGEFNSNIKLCPECGELIEGTCQSSMAGKMIDHLRKAHGHKNKLRKCPHCDFEGYSLGFHMKCHDPEFLDAKLPILEQRARIESFINNHYATVVKVSKFPRPSKNKWVYSLEVEGTHNYFVVAREFNGLSARSVGKPLTPILVSNCHRANSECFSIVVNRLNPLYRIGVTATPLRKDMRHVVMQEIIGPVTSIGKSNQMHCQVEYIYSGITIEKSQQFTTLENRIIKNDDRNEAIILHMMQMVQRGRFILAVTTRVGHALMLSKRLNEQFIKAEPFYGGTPDREGLLNRARSGETYVIIAMRKMVLGIDVPRWDVFYNLTPSANQYNYYQECSRVRTPFEGKPMPLIFDVIDDNDICYACRNIRQRVYEEQGFEIKNPPKKSKSSKGWH